jgi:hypothetical protein
MKSMRIIFCVAAFVFCTGLRSGQDRGGGDEIGLEFVAIAQSTLADLQKNQNFLYEQIKSKNLDEILVNMRVMTVDTSLKVSVGPVTQDSVAVNDRKDQTILVNRQRWHAIRDVRVKAGIVLHEILSLAGLEETGFYPISSRYVNDLGISSEAIQPIKDEDHTYLSCLDTNSALLVLSISQNYRLTAEIRALNEDTLTKLRELAKLLNVKNTSNIVGVSFDIQAKARFSSDTGQYTDNCTLDLYNKALVNCDDGASGTHSVSREFTFKKSDGSTVTVRGESIWFAMAETTYPAKTRLVSLIAEVPVQMEMFATPATLNFNMNMDSCR